MTNHRHQGDGRHHGHHPQGDVWLQYFACCFTTQQPHHPGKRRHMRLDPSMIGLPTNFQHTGHVGCNDLGASTAGHMTALHNQLQSKGGYNMALPIAAASNRNNLLSLDTRPLLPSSAPSSMPGMPHLHQGHGHGQGRPIIIGPRGGISSPSSPSSLSSSTGSSVIGPANVSVGYGRSR